MLEETLKKAGLTRTLRIEWRQTRNEDKEVGRDQSILDLMAHTV